MLLNKTLISLIIVALSTLKCTDSKALTPTGSFPVERKPLYVPPLEELAQAFRSYLPTNFAEVAVEVVDSPDLTKEPFLLAAEGLGGNQKLVEVGDLEYIVPKVIEGKTYDLKDAAKLTDVEPAFIIGAGAGPRPYVGSNSEGFYNLKIEKGTVDQLSRIVKLVGPEENLLIQELPQNETRFSFLASLYISEGKPGKVIKVHVKQRTGPQDFVATLRNALQEKYGQQDLIGVGGAFLIANGKAKQQIARNYTSVGVNESAVKVFEMSTPQIALGTFASNNGGNLDVTLQHFHGFSTNGEAGHYLNDITPDTVEYLGYFNVAHEIIRIDKPAKTV